MASQASGRGFRLPPIIPAGISRDRTRSHLIDLVMIGLVLALFYGILALARTWLGPFTPAATISRSPGALPLYSAYSLLRIAIAYFLSLGFAIAYGYIAAYSPKAERWMIPLLDIMQSIPVLSFLPGVMLAMIALFPHSQLGVEIGAILLIFTGQVWNIAFSFYSSLRSIPRELYEAASIYRFSRWQRLTQLELPYSTMGLVWNSIMSVAGGWFFLMACEMFALQDRDFRLPGLGSYLQTATDAGDTRAIVWGLAAMVAVVVLTDLLVWRPVVAWADKFKFEQVEAAGTSESALLVVLRRSPTVALLRKRIFTPLADRTTLFFARRRARPGASRPPARWQVWLGGVAGAGLLVVSALALVRAGLLLAGLTGPQVADVLRGAGLTFLRVACALVVGAAWAVPAGVAIGFSPRLARIAQPLAQIAASIPAPFLFPLVLLVLSRLGQGMGLGAFLLMLLGTQWYILFNVIAGAIGIPSDLKEAARVFHFRRSDRWRLLILPGIFPYLLTGLVTAAGGAWNASIIAEYFKFKGNIKSTPGLGSIISRAADKGDFQQLLTATIVMAAIVVLTNRFLWRRLYRLAETRYKLET